MKIYDKKLAYPYFVWMVLFTVVPLFIVVYYAMTDAEGNFTLNNLTSISGYGSVFARSLLLALIATVICLIIAFPVGYFLSRLRVNKQHIMLMLVMLPMWMNFLLRTYAWMGLLSVNGPVNTLLGFIGLGPYTMLNTSGAVVLGMVYNYVPYMILPLYTSMTKIDQSLVEAAQDLGANTTKTLVRVLIPMSVPGISTGITMVFVPAVSTFVISRMLGGGSNLLIGDLIEMQFLGNSYNLNVGSAMSLVLMIIVLLCMSFTSSFDALLKKYRPKGIVHCYSGSAEDAVQLAAQGLYIGFGGACTFNGAKRAANAIEALPLDAIVLETDCPYMAPEPVRGTRCDSSLIRYVGTYIAQRKALAPEEVFCTTAANARRVFGL